MVPLTATCSTGMARLGTRIPCPATRTTPKPWTRRLRTSSPIGNVTGLSSFGGGRERAVHLAEDRGTDHEEPRACASVPRRGARGRRDPRRYPGRSADRAGARGRSRARPHELRNGCERHVPWPPGRAPACRRSEEHTSELQSHSDLVCRLLLEKKKKKIYLSTICKKQKKTKNKIN